MIGLKQSDFDTEQDICIEFKPFEGSLFLSRKCCFCNEYKFKGNFLLKTLI
jgi:hypothetical protein